MIMIARAAVLLTFTLLLAACDSAQVPEEEAQGPDPKIPAPSGALIPTINIARATGWPQGEMPKPANGLAVKAFATGLDHPRWLYVLPDGDVLVAETNTPKQEGAGRDQRLDHSLGHEPCRCRRAEPKSYRAVARRGW